MFYTRMYAHMPAYIILYFNILAYTQHIRINPSYLLYIIDVHSISKSLLYIMVYHGSSWRLLWGPTRLLWGPRAYCGIRALVCIGMSLIPIHILVCIGMSLIYFCMNPYILAYTSYILTYICVYTPVYTSIRLVYTGVYAYIPGYDGSFSMLCHMAGPFPMLCHMAVYEPYVHFHVYVICMYQRNML